MRAASVSVSGGCYYLAILPVSSVQRPSAPVVPVAGGDDVDSSTARLCEVRYCSVAFSMNLQHSCFSRCVTIVQSPSTDVALPASTESTLALAAPLDHDIAAEPAKAASQVN